MGTPLDGRNLKEKAPNRHLVKRIKTCRNYQSFSPLDTISAHHLPVDGCRRQGASM